MVASAVVAVCLVVAGIQVAQAGPDAFSALAGHEAAPPGPTAAEGAVPAPAPTTEAAATAPSASATVEPTPEPTATAIPLGASGQALREGLAGALAARTFPADLTPKPDQWATTADQSAAMKACVATVASNPRSCTFGNPDGPEIDVVGDSLGLPLLAAVVAAYGKDYKVRGLTKIACGVNGIDANYGKDEWAVPCVNHRAMVLDHVAKTRPAAVLVIETYAWATRLKSKASGAAAAAEWTRADQAFTDALRAGTNHVVFVSPSIPGVAFLDCYRAGRLAEPLRDGYPGVVAGDAGRRATGDGRDVRRHPALVLRRRPVPDLHHGPRHRPQGRLPAPVGPVHAAGRGRPSLPADGSRRPVWRSLGPSRPDARDGSRPVPGTDDLDRYARRPVTAGAGQLRSGDVQRVGEVGAPQVGTAEVRAEQVGRSAGRRPAGRRR